MSPKAGWQIHAGLLTLQGTGGQKEAKESFFSQADRWASCLGVTMMAEPQQHPGMSP